MSKVTAATRMTTKGQVVIPKAIRARLRWRAGVRLRVETEGDKVVLSTDRAAWFESWAKEVAGCVTRGDPVGDLEAEHRAEVERDARRRP